MRITESRLRRLIRSVIKENLSDMHTNVVSKMSAIRLDDDFFETVNDFIKNDIGALITNISWQGRYPEEELRDITKPFTADQDGEYFDDACEFSVSKHAGEKAGSLIFKFESDDESNSKSFGVECYITPGYSSNDYDDDEPGECVCKFKSIS